MGEAASLGTLLELGNRSLDVLKNLVQRPPGQSISDFADLPGPYSTALGVKEGVVIVRRNLEEILMYSVTQLAMWLSKPDFESAVTITEDDAPILGTGTAFDSTRIDSLREKKAAPAASPRTSITLAERLRRGMGEIAGDLQALLVKSKPVFAASDQVIGKPSVDLTQIMLSFLQEHVGNSA